MRGKEEAQDYRYFPDPDLIPITVPDEWVKEIRASLPELPAARRQRFVEQYGLPDYDAGVLTSSRGLADYFEDAAKGFSDPKKVSNFIMGELMRELKSDDRELSECPVTPGMLAGLLKLVEKGAISGKIAKDVFAEMYATGRQPADIVEEKGLAVERDEGALTAVIDEILAESPDQVEQYRAGKTKVLGFFMGQVMKKTRGKADPKLANEMLRKRLAG
jgi:aspartyl-tRNA(Asn)/glutamyl-tRNA(Gln) amidotransferase subunit B